MSFEIKNVYDKANSLRGCLSHLKQNTGRRRFLEDEDPLIIDNCFVSDEAKLLSSKTFRVMVNKTQVFTFPKTPLIRNRQAHVLEVAATSCIASEMLGLNTDLVRAAAIGHDIGHVPFGHQGEFWIAKKMGDPKFCHEIMGVIVSQKIERKGSGLNLCHETLEAMMRHSGKNAIPEMTQEAWVLRYADKFTYIFHDINDVVGRMRYPISRELQGIVDSFGHTQRERVSTAIAGLVVESYECGRVSFELSDLGKRFQSLRDMMYGVYVHVTQQNVNSVMEPVLEFLEMLKIGNPFLLLALMTDKDVAYLAGNPMKDMQAFNQTAISEIAPYLNDIGDINLSDPDLNW